MMNKAQVDSRNNHYAETPMGNGEFTRVTHIKNGWPGCDTIRIQVRDQKGHLRFGPELPKSIIVDLFHAANVATGEDSNK